MSKALLVSVLTSAVIALAAVALASRVDMIGKLVFNKP